MPFKTFVAGTEGLASDVNTYLMKQSVMVFADATARNAALTSPTEGMVTYQEANDHLTIYNGSSWVAYDIGAWQAYTPTLTNITLGTGGTASFYYQRIGKTINVRGRILLGTGGSLGGIPTFSLPVNSVISGQFWGAGVSLLDFGVQNYTGAVTLTTTVAQVNCVSAAGAYAGFLSVNATRPFTWGAQDQMDFSFSYEAA